MRLANAFTDYMEYRAMAYRITEDTYIVEVAPHDHALICGVCATVEDFGAEPEFVNLAEAGSGYADIPHCDFCRRAFETETIGEGN